MSKSWREADDDLKYRKRQSLTDWREEVEEQLEDMENDCE